MANAYSFQPQPQTPSVDKFTVGQMLAQRRFATDPQNATPGGTPLTPGQSTMRGALPAVGRRLLQTSPTGGPSQTSAGFGGSA